LAASVLIQEGYPALAQGAAEVASPQLRNQGTLGGNLCQKPRCWYYRGEFLCLRKGGDKCYAYAGENQYHCIFGGSVCFITHPSDTAPGLMAYGAAVRIAGPKGLREVPAEKFFILPEKNVEKETVLEPNEIVTEILLPPSRMGWRGSYRKVRARRSWDFALAGVALALKFRGDVVDEARVVLSGAAPIPWRSREAEQSITGKRLDGETVARAAQVAVKDARPLKNNGYKVSLFRGMIEEELLQISKA
jgi:xanthine dehydrogenase YagS FAD-binding subunit